MALKFAANISTMFKEKTNLLDRYAAARSSGFRFVEATFLYDLPLDEVQKRKIEAGVKQVLINAFPGDLANGDLGLAAIPSRQKEFRDTLELAIKYCKALDCQRLHIMAGKIIEGVKVEEMEKVYVENLKFSADRLSKENIIGVIEPINSFTIPGYFLNNYDDAVKYVKAVNSPNLKIQLDFFHMQHICGNLTKKIEELLPYVGHIQIAQVPDRHEPNTFGEIRYDYIFKLLTDFGYDGFIGCEYFPKGDTVKGLGWVQEYGCTL